MFSGSALKLSDLGIREGHRVLKFGIGEHEVVHCKRLSSFCKGEARVDMLKDIQSWLDTKKEYMRLFMCQV